jgi:hypothetical protein
MSRYINGPVLQVFKNQVLEWDLQRISATLSNLLVRFEACGTERSLIRAARNDSLPVLYEILNYPHYLLDSKMDTLISRILIELHRHKTKLRLQEFIYPGILILIVHSDEKVRELGQAYLGTATTMLSERDQNVVMPILKAMLNHIRSLQERSVIEKSYNFTMDLAEMWAGVFRFIKYTSKVSIPHFLTHSAVDMDKLLLDSFHSNLSGQYWPRCKLLEIVLKYTSCSWTIQNFAGDYAAITITTMIQDQELNSVMKMVEGEYSAEKVTYHCDVIFSLLLLLLKLTQKSEWIRQPLNWLTQQSQYWNKTALERMKVRIQEMINVKAIDQKFSDMALPWLVSQKVSLPNHAILDLLLQDIKKLKRFGDDYRGTTTLAQNHTELWKKLDIIELSVDQVTLLIESIASIGFLSNLDDAAQTEFNGLWSIVVKQTCWLLGKYYKQLKLKWYLVFKLMFFNDKQIQRLAEEKLLLDSGRDTVSGAIEYYLLLHREKLVEKVYDYLKDYQELILNGFIVVNSANRILDWFTSCQIIYTTKGMENLYQNFWLRLFILCSKLFNESSKWCKSTYYDKVPFQNEEEVKSEVGKLLASSLSNHLLQRVHSLRIVVQGKVE